MFTYICDEFTCSRCGARTPNCFQTKLFETSDRNALREYRRGDVVRIDGLVDYMEVNPWRTGEPLRVIMGDWICPSCGLNYQWSLVTFDLDDRMERLGEPFGATIRSIEKFAPLSSDAFSEINMMETELAEFADLPVKVSEKAMALSQMPLEQRITAVVDGYRRWLQGVI